MHIKTKTLHLNHFMRGAVHIMKTKHLRRCAAAGLSALLPAVSLTALPPMSVSAAGTVVINEVCTKNTTLAASDGQFYDYVELYNTGSSPVSLAGYGLTDDAAQPFAFTFGSNVTIGANSYYYVWCGVKDTTAGASFGLSKNGETITLTAPGGAVENQLEVPGLADDTAYGRMPDGSDKFAVLSRLTPGAANPTDALVKVSVEKPAFSQGSGFYANSFDLTLSAGQGSTIYYTTDGSDPTTASARYSGPINVYDKSDEPNVYAAETDIASNYGAPADPVDKAMIVRAIAVDAQGNVSDIATNTYFIGYTDNGLAKNMRVISLVTDPDNLFDPEKGIYVRGKTYEDWRNSPEYSMMAREWEIPANYTQSGKQWERPAHITVFENGQATYSEAVGIRMHGGATRSAAQKSFNLYARADYGDTKIRYDFFDGKLLNEKGKVIDTFDKLSLRNGGNDSTTKSRDRINQEAVAGCDFGIQAQTECIVFLDGEFWGAYNIIEKIGKEYVADHYKVKEDDVCVIKTDEQEDGTDKGLADYESLKSFAQSSNFSDKAVYEQFCQMVDVNSFAQYMATELILGNSDFGDNNYCLWKTETVDSSKKFADGKWRFILFDTEYGQGLYGQSNSNSSIMQSLKQKNCWISKLFFGLLDNSEEFRQVFVPTYFSLCNENYKADKMTAAVSAYGSLYLDADAETEKRFNSGTPSWGGGWVMPGGPGQGPGQGQQKDYTQSVRKELDTIRSFWQNRDTNAKQILLNYLSGKVSNQTCTVTMSDPGSYGTVKLNSIALTFENGTWSGTYPTDCLLTLDAEPAEGYSFAGWEITGADGSSMSSAHATAAPTGNQVTIKPIFTASGTPSSEFTASDVKKLRDYLVTAGTLTSAEASRYDLDKNGRLNAADLTQMKRTLVK